MRPIIALTLLLAGAQTRAGDYQLMVQQHWYSHWFSCRNAYATARASPQEVIADLLAALQDREPRIRALRAMVMNAHIAFCTREDRLELERGLADIGTQVHLVQERKYTDFVLMLATESLVKELKARLASPDVAPAARKRLAFLSEEAPRWITFRRTGKWPPRSRAPER